MYQIMNQTSVNFHPKAVFVDIDNTLLDFDEYVRTTMREGFAHFGLRTYEPRMYDVFLSINTGLWRQIERGELDFDTLQKIRWNRIFEALEIEFDGPTFETYFREALYTSAIPVKGAYELIGYLSKKYYVCAASNGPEDQQINRMKLAGLYPMLTDLYASEAIGASKPSPLFFEEALRHLNQKVMGDGEKIEAKDVVMLGDSLTSDMDGGIEAGMCTCYFSRGDETPDLQGRSVGLVISELTELCRLL